MINFFEHLFAKPTSFSYTIAEYQPVKIDRMRSNVNVTEYDALQDDDFDEEEIGVIYKSF